MPLMIPVCDGGDETRLVVLVCAGGAPGFRGADCMEAGEGLLDSGYFMCSASDVGQTMGTFWTRTTQTGVENMYDRCIIRF